MCLIIQARNNKLKYCLSVDFLLLTYSVTTCLLYPFLRLFTSVFRAKFIILKLQTLNSNLLFLFNFQFLINYLSHFLLVFTKVGT